MRRVIVTGSRDWASPGPVISALMRAWGDLGPFVLVHGDARGADRMAAGYHQRWGGACEAHAADWRGLGKRAGYVRNAEMVGLGADLVLAFWDGSSPGTKMMIDLVTEAGIPLRVFTPDTPSTAGDISTPDLV